MAINLTQLAQTVGSTEVQHSDFAPSGTIKSGVYLCTINKAVLQESSRSAAVGVNFDLIDTESGRHCFDTVWFTNGKGETTYTDKSGKKVALPGLQTISAVCELLGVKFNNVLASAVEVEKETRLTGIEGKELYFAIREESVPEVTKDSLGNYVETGNSVLRNTIQLVATMQSGVLKTFAEISEGKEAKVIDMWKQAYEGKDPYVNKRANTAKPAAEAAPTRPLNLKKAKPAEAEQPADDDLGTSDIPF